MMFSHVYSVVSPPQKSLQPPNIQPAVHCHQVNCPDGASEEESLSENHQQDQTPASREENSETPSVNSQSFALFEIAENSHR